jgi:hypothetical protein
MDPTNFTYTLTLDVHESVKITPTSDANGADQPPSGLGGLSGSNPGVWAASNGSTASNWASASTGGATPLVPGSAAAVTFSANGIATAPTGTVTGQQA